MNYDLEEAIIHEAVELYRAGKPIRDGHAREIAHLSFDDISPAQQFALFGHIAPETIEQVRGELRYREFADEHAATTVEMRVLLAYLEEQGPRGVQEDWMRRSPTPLQLQLERARTHRGARR